MNTLTYNYCVENRKDFPKLSLFASWTGAMINPQWLELAMSQTNFHGPKDVRAIEVRLYFSWWLAVGSASDCSSRDRKVDSQIGHIQLTLVISTSLITNNRLSRSENLVSVKTWKFNNRWQSIVEKNGQISPLCHNIFNRSLISRVKLHIRLLNVVVCFIFSLILQIWYVELRIARSISDSPLNFAITRVDCTFGEKWSWNHFYSLLLLPLVL